MKWTKTVLIVLAFLGIIVLALTPKMNAYNRKNSLRKSLVKQNEGFFPLYEKGFAKMISVAQHPYLLQFFVYIEASAPINLNWEDVILKLEAIKDGQVIGSHLIQGECADMYDSRSGLTNKYTFAVSKPIGYYNPRNAEVTLNDYNNMRQMTTGKVSVYYFNMLEPGIYRVTVVQPCEAYEYTVTELHTYRAY